MVKLVSGIIPPGIWCLHDEANSMIGPQKIPRPPRERKTMKIFPYEEISPGQMSPNPTLKNTANFFEGKIFSQVYLNFIYFSCILLPCQGHDGTVECVNQLVSNSFFCYHTRNKVKTSHPDHYKIHPKLYSRCSYRLWCNSFGWGKLKKNEYFFVKPLWLLLMYCSVCHAQKKSFIFVSLTIKTLRRESFLFSFVDSITMSTNY